jgi:hypothetical protein
MSYEAKLVETYAGVRERLFNGAMPVPRVSNTRPYVRPDFTPRLSPPPPQGLSSKPRALNPTVHGTPPTWKQIALDVSEKHGVSLVGMIGECRLGKFVAARHEAFYRIRTETNLSFPQIGFYFGGRDHTTVIHGVNAYAKRHAIAPEEIARLKKREAKLTGTLRAVRSRLALLSKDA